MLRKERMSNRYSGSPNYNKKNWRSKEESACWVNISDWEKRIFGQREGQAPTAGETEEDRSSPAPETQLILLRDPHLGVFQEWKT